MLESGSSCGYISNSESILECTRFGSTYAKIGTIQRRLAWPLRKDDTQIREAFHILPIFFNFINVNLTD